MKKTIRFIDLFAGTGGIRLAFEQAMHSHGFQTKCVKSVEIDEHACETYELNFHENPKGDVRDIDELPPFDVLLAGFPCQAFSYAGKQMGFADTRGTLFFEVERILTKYHPKLCFLENVRGLTTHDGGKTFKTIVSKLEALGYHVEYRLINASSMGIPQNRTRIYFICTYNFVPKITIDSNLGAADSHSFKRQSSQELFDFAKPERTITVKDILEENADSKYDCSTQFVEELRYALDGKFDELAGKRLIDTRHGNSIHSWDLGHKGKCSASEIRFMDLLISNRRRHDFGTEQDGKALTIEQIKTFYLDPDIESVINSLLEKKYLKLENGKYNPVCGNMSFEVFKFLDPDSICITLTSSDANRLGVYYNGRIRRLTPRECARLQGYPDTYRIHPNDACAYKQFGNAVCVPVIEQLISNLLENNKKFF